MTGGKPQTGPVERRRAVAVCVCVRACAHAVLVCACVVRVCVFLLSPRVYICLIVDVMLGRKRGGADSLWCACVRVFLRGCPPVCVAGVALILCSALRLRATHPDVPRPYSIPLGTVVTTPPPTPLALAFLLNACVRIHARARARTYARTHASTHTHTHTHTRCQGAFV